MGTSSGGPEELKSIREIFTRRCQIGRFFDSSLFFQQVHHPFAPNFGGLVSRLEACDVSDYKRSLDLSTAISHTNYKVEGNEVEQKVFVSHPHQVMVINLSSNYPEGLNGNIRLDRPLDEGEKTVTVKSFDQQIIMQGEVTQRAGKFKSEPHPILSGVNFQTRLSQHEGGRITAIDDRLEVSGLKTHPFIASNSIITLLSMQKKMIKS